VLMVFLSGYADDKKRALWIEDMRKHGARGD
jgi:hypothetical protein